MGENMLSNTEFYKYLFAHEEIEELHRQYEIERQEAYEDISPTMTLFDYDAGFVVSGSVSVEEYVIYLMELYERFKKRVENCNRRIELLNEAISLLYEDEKAEFEVWKENPRGKYPKVLSTLKECLEFVLEGVANSQQLENEMTVEEWDAQIDAMSDEELFSDYWDKEDKFDEVIKEQNRLLKEYGKIPQDAKIPTWENIFRREIKGKIISEVVE